MGPAVSHLGLAAAAWLVNGARSVPCCQLVSMQCVSWPVNTPQWGNVAGTGVASTQQGLEASVMRERERENHFTSMFQALMDLLDEAHSYMKKSTAREAFLPRQRKPNATMQH